MLAALQIVLCAIGTWSAVLAYVRLMRLLEEQKRREAAERQWVAREVNALHARLARLESGIQSR